MLRQVPHRPFAAISAFLAASICLFWHVPARADELTAFERAREAYEGARYRQAIERFEALVGGETPRLRSAPLVLESRKYLAASYLFAGESKRAEDQFVRLLEADPSYQLDPVAFPQEVHQLFASVRERVDARARERRAERAREEEEARAREDERERLRARIVALEEVARQEVVRTESSRWVAAIPFGVGQFQNGHRRLGIALAVTQSVLAATALTTFLLHRDVVQTALPGEALPGCPVGETSFCEQLQRRERGYRYTNWISSGLLGALIAYGILDAQLRFVPHRESTRERELPPEPRAAGRDVRVNVGLGALQLRVGF
jgi:tetratricopeptide (TPR) repeat protein